MSYYTANISNHWLSKSDLENPMKTLSDTPEFQTLIKHNDIRIKDLVKDLMSVANIVSVLSDLNQAHNIKFYVDGTNNYSLENYHPSEVKYIKSNSMAYRYFRYKLEETSVDGIVLQGNIKDFFLCCFITGFAGYKLEKVPKISKEKMELAYFMVVDFANRHIVRIPFGQERKIYKKIIKQSATDTLYKDNSAIKFNFMQKNATKNHGIEYVRLGRSVALLLEDVEKGRIEL